MTLLQTVTKALEAWPQTRGDDQQVCVPTHCLYGSGAVVRVTVTGRDQRFVVHDAGSAIAELTAYGGDFPSPVKMLRAHFRERGIAISDLGAITSPVVEREGLMPAIALIANASQEAETFLTNRWRPTVKRDFKRALAALLETEFRSVRSAVHVPGASAKQHKFDFSVFASHERQILVDAVLLDQNAISSAVLRNLDVANRRAPKLEQRIIYDDFQDWRAEDLSLLRLGGIVVPFSAANEVLTRLAH